MTTYVKESMLGFSPSPSPPYTVTDESGKPLYSVRADGSRTSVGGSSPQAPTSTPPPATKQQEVYQTGGFGAASGGQYQDAVNQVRSGLTSSQTAQPKQTWEEFQASVDRGAFEGFGTPTWDEIWGAYSGDYRYTPGVEQKGYSPTFDEFAGGMDRATWERFGSPSWNQIWQTYTGSGGGVTNGQTAPAPGPGSAPPSGVNPNAGNPNFQMGVPGPGGGYSAGGGGFQSGAGQWGYTPATYEAMTGKAQEYASQGLEITPDMLVNEHVAKLMRSPVGKMAAEVAKEFMNARGMLDSSAAINAIVQATIKAGLPIAERDAAAYLEAAKETVAAENIARQQNAASRNQMTQLNMNAINAQRTFNAQQETAARQWTAEKSFESYWKDKAFKEDVRQFDLNYQIEQGRLALDQDQSEATKAAIAMDFAMAIAGSGMSKEEMLPAILVARDAGIITPAFADSMWVHMPGVQVDPTEVV